jgi:hypothetical protein
MTFNEFMQKMLDAFPQAQVGEDNDGQLVIYTNLKIDPSSDHSSGDTELVVSFDP